MTKQILIHSATASYKTTESNIRHILSETGSEQGLEVRSEELTAHWTTLFFRINYAWDIDPVEDAYQVTENQYISRKWLALVLPPPIIYASDVLIRGFTDYASAALLIPAAMLLTLPLFIGAFIPLIRAPNLIGSTRQLNDQYTAYSPALVYILLIFSLIVLSLVSTLAEVAGAILISLVTGFFVTRYDWFVEAATVFNSNTIPFPADLTLKAGAFLPPAFLLLAGSEETFVLLVTVLFSIGVLWAFFHLIPETMPIIYYGFRKAEQKTWPRHSVYAGSTFLLHVILSYGTFAIYLELLHRFDVLSAPGDSPFTTLSLAVIGLPFMTILFGITLQSFMFMRQNLGLFWHSTPAALPWLDHVDAEVRELHVETDRAGCISIGVKDYVFLSTTLLENLDQEEITAIAMHEEGHIKQGDALLSMVVAVISPIFLTGKNVLYNLLDFRDREFQADQYAAEKSSLESLRSALLTVESRSTASSSSLTEGLTPTFASFSRFISNTGRIPTYFMLLYGNFALTEAHPSIPERIEILE